MVEDYPVVPLGKLSKDLSGEVFGKLTALYRTSNKIQPNGTVKSQWVCECSCGKTKAVQSQNLTRGIVLSCGKCESSTTKVFKVMDIKGVSYGYEGVKGFGNTKHGQSGKRCFDIWQGILSRCFNEECKAYPYYGGKGITVCERWLTLKNFMEDNESLCGEHLSIDRIDGDKDYCPENTRWIPLPDQSKNTSPKHWGKVKYKGVCWSDKKGKYRSNCYLEGKQTHLGFFDCPIDAALKYDLFVSTNKDIYWLNRDHFQEVMDKFLSDNT